MGIFPEDSKIRASMVIELWVAEGFLKPISGKTLEDIAEEYLTELINRNLIRVHELGHTGNIKYCNIHDLLRDLCLREAQKERFYNVTRQRNLNVLQGINAQRRIVIPRSTSEERVLDASQSMSLARSFICDTKKVLPSLNFRLLRILKAYDEDSYTDEYDLEDIFQLVNSRYISIRGHLCSQFPSSIYLLWNLQTLILRGGRIMAPVEIWKMPQLRHVVFREGQFEGLYLPDPPSGHVGRQDGIVMGNLQTLERITNFKCGEEVVKRIPNIRKLKTYYWEYEKKLPNYYLNNLEHLHKLESFGCIFLPGKTNDFVQNFTFPHSLKKLTLETNIFQYWEDMLEKVGSLPLLEKFIIGGGLINGRKWETVEGQFRSLKFLKIHGCLDIEYWTTESSHFPRLEHLHLGSLGLKEIPSEIGDIPTLKSISVYWCSDSAVISAKRILDEQEELGNEGLRVEVTLDRRNRALQMLASPNFQVVVLFD